MYQQIVALMSSCYRTSMQWQGFINTHIWYHRFIFLHLISGWLFDNLAVVHVWQYLMNTYGRYLSFQLILGAVLMRSIWGQYFSTMELTIDSHSGDSDDLREELWHLHCWFALCLLVAPFVSRFAVISAMMPLHSSLNVTRLIPNSLAHSYCVQHLLFSIRHGCSIRWFFL